MFGFLSGVFGGFGELLIFLLPFAIFVYLLEFFVGLWQFLIFKVLVISVAFSLLISKSILRKKLPAIALLCDKYLLIYATIIKLIVTLFIGIFKTIKVIPSLILKFFDTGDKNEG